MNIHVHAYTYMHVATINEKWDHEFEKERIGMWEGSGGRKAKGEMV